MTKKLFSVLLLLGITGVIFGQACSNSALMGSSATQAETGFTLTATTTSLAPGASTQITETGGTSPFSWSVEFGGGTISTTGLYMAATSVTSQNNSVIVDCTDALGNIARINLNVTPNGLTATYTPNPATPGQSVLITIVGGTAPYTIQAINALGTISGNLYQSTTTAETATLQIYDATGLSTSLSLAIGTSVYGSSVAYTSMAVTAPGTHLVNGGSGCVSPYTQLGMVADGYGNYLQGDQMFCGELVTATIGTTVITDIQLTPNQPAGTGTHMATPTCNAGYTLVGEVTDCSGGSCSGFQAICVTLATMASGVTPVQQFSVTAENIHTTIPACPSGLTAVGYVTDCGYGTCSGYQAFCVKK